jgi:diguanylate cyclase (GGDEF)-like protein/PAS domain S-box-containing protein
MSRRKLVPAYLLLSLICAAGYFTLGELGATLCYITMSAAVLVSVAIGVAKHRPKVVRPWLVLGAGQAAFLIADVLWYSLALNDPQAIDGGYSVADVFYLAGYPLLALGLVMLIGARQPRYRLTAAIDAILVGIGAMLVLWVVAIDAVVHDETIPLLQRLITSAYPIGDVIVLAAAAYLLLTGPHGRRSLYLLVASLVALLGGDVVEMTVASGATIPSPADAFWLVSYALFGLAALEPSMREISEPSDAPFAPEGTGRLLLIGGAISILPLFAVYEKLFTDHVDFGLIGVVGLVVIVAVLVRMHELGAVLGRQQRRHASLLANASDAFAIVDYDGQFKYVSAASERVLGYSPDATVGRSVLDLVEPGRRTRSVAMLRHIAATPGSKQELEVHVRRADGEWRWLSVTATNRKDDPLIDGVVLNYRDITERRELEQRLERQAFTDALTGLANRALFVDRLGHVLGRRRREGEAAPVSVLFLDVDDFKTVNDSLGHAAGDQLLTALAKRLTGALRPGDTAARLGGDEFAILLENTAERDARTVATRVLGAIARPIEIAGVEVRVSVSIGVAVDAPDATTTADELLRDADLAMYTAKGDAPGTYAVYEPSMHAAVLRRLEQKADVASPPVGRRGRTRLRHGQSREKREEPIRAAT